MNKKLLTLFLFIISALVTPLIVAAQYPSQNITMLSGFDDLNVPAEPTYNIRYNGIWGWTDSTGREYACIGATNGVFIVEVTNPTAPVQRDFIPGCVVNCIWRELKTYNNYLYMVSDDGGPNCLQIADLSYLPDSVHIVHQGSTIIKNSHTIFVDGDKLYCAGARGGVLGANTVSMSVFSLANPASPVLLRELTQDYPAISYVHDMFVRNDTVYASAAYDGLQIYKYNSTANNFTSIASITTYPFQGYNHSSVLTDDSKTIIFADEVPTGLPLKAYDISDLQNITFGSIFRSTPTSTATPHNPFMINGHYCVTAYYQDGIQIFDVSDPANIVRLGYFDSNPNDGAGLPNPSYSGCWGAYTEFTSGNIIASDMQNGLFVLDASSILGIPSPVAGQNTISVFPNPAKDYLQLSLNSLTNEKFSIEIFDVTGKRVFEKQESLFAGKSVLNLNIEKLSAGFYVVKIKSSSFNLIKQIVKAE